MQKMTCLLGLTAAVLTGGPAAAAFLDFEDAPDRDLTDNHEITDQYDDAGVTFEGAYLERTGGGDGNPQGFLNDQDGAWDTQFAATPGLGDWFLRSAGEVSQRGGQGIFLSILYATSVTAAAGQIWDIDGNSAQGTEAWEVQALLDGNLQQTAASPEGSSNGAGSLDGLPWRFELSGSEFDRIDFVFVGSKESGVGLAFDNFNTNSVPLPATGLLMGLGLLAIAAGRRRW